MCDLNPITCGEDFVQALSLDEGSEGRLQVNVPESSNKIRQGCVHVETVPVLCMLCNVTSGEAPQAILKCTVQMYVVRLELVCLDCGPVSCSFLWMRTALQ